MNTKQIWLKALFTVFIFLCAFTVWGQEPTKPDKLMSALLSNNCAQAVKVAESLRRTYNEYSEDNSLLYFAISADCIEVVKILLDKGADINKRLGENGYTPLIEGITKGNFDLLRFLLERGADVNVQAKGISPLMAAILKDNNEMAKLVIQNGAEVDLKSAKGETALLIASAKGHIDLVSLLIEKGANINIQNMDGYSALMVASVAGKTDVVKLLIQSGANLELKTTETGETALTLATANDKAEVAKLLLDNGAVEPKLISVPDEKIAALKQQLFDMSYPFSLYQLGQMVKSTDEYNMTINYKLNPATGRWIVCLAYENKVDVIAIKKPFNEVEFIAGNDVSIQWFCAGNKGFYPERLFTLCYPSDKVLTYDFFSTIITWWGYEEIKDFYTFINGKWYKRLPV